MPLVDRVLAWLTQLETRVADRALGAALDHAEPPHLEMLTKALLARRRSGAWCTLFHRWDRIAPDVRAMVFDASSLALDGLALAIRDGPLHGRLNALTAFEQRPFANLAHLLVNALLDPASPPLRERAAAALRTAALAALEQPDPSAALAESHRRKIVDALREALRAIDTHLRVEIVEPCLWYASALGSTLWTAVQKPRSRVAHVINESLTLWNHPRLAGFLLTGLDVPELRRRCRALLGEWRGAPCAAALLAQTAQLDREELRRSLSGIKSPPWFEGCDPRLGDIAPELRPLAPRWVLAAGYTPAQRLALFEGWLRSEDYELQLAVVDALSHMTDDADARAVLQNACDAGGRIAARARECLGDAYIAPSPDPTKSPDPAGATPDNDFPLFWQWCRRTPVHQLHQPVEVLKRRAEQWADLLAAVGRSPDPHDRLLSLYLLCEAGLAGRFRGPLRALLRDDHIEVRHAAETLLDEHPDASHDSRPGPHADRSAQRRIREALEELRLELERSSDQYSAMESQVRRLLREADTGSRFQDAQPPAGGTP